MKRFVVICLSFVLLIARSFAGGADFFDHRIFEIKVNVPVDISNNTLSVADFLQREVIIDLKELYYGMPKKGFNLTADTMPNVSVTLDFKKGIHFGVLAGVDLYSKFGISKDLFKLLAKGNSLDDDIKISIDGYVDAFAFGQIDVGFNLNKFNIRVQPAVFASLAHVATNDAYVKASYDKENNTYNLAVNGNMDFFSAIPMTNELAKDTNQMINQMVNQLGPSMGFDMSGQVSFKPIDILTVTGSVRIPLAPSHLSYRTTLNYSNEWPFSVDQLTGNKKESEGESSEGDSKESSPGLDQLFSDPVAEKYYIHRPMKLAVSANFKPFSWLMSYYGTLGLGIKHPFAQNKAETYVYVDYLIGTKLSLVNIISLYLSTERTDEIYKHKATLALNFRLVEVDAGIAFESSNLKTSFKGSGLGAFVTACVGF